MKAVTERAPQLLAFVKWVYNQTSRLWAIGHEEGTPPIRSMTGVRQGDPMGPLLFALALQSALKESLAAVTDAHLVAFHDDVTLVATAEKVAARYAALDSCTTPLGLRTNRFLATSVKMSLSGLRRREMHFRASEHPVLSQGTFEISVQETLESPVQYQGLWHGAVC
jgi:hypothetical protein